MRVSTEDSPGAGRFGCPLGRTRRKVGPAACRRSPLMAAVATGMPVEMAKSNLVRHAPGKGDPMNERDPRRQTRRHAEERIAELRRELVVGEACAGPVPVRKRVEDVFPLAPPDALVPIPA